MGLGHALDKAEQNRTLALQCRLPVKAPYVRAGELSKKARTDRTNTKRNLVSLLCASDLDIINMMIEDGFLRDMNGVLCPRCGSGKLGP